MSEEHISTLDGEVLKSETWSETHVSGSSSGGGGYVGAQGGNVAAPTVTVTSTVTENLRIFLKLPDGGERDFKLRNWPFGFREGNQVRAVWFGDLFAGMANKTTNKQHVIWDNTVLKALRKLKFVPKRMHPHIISILVLAVFVLNYSHAESIDFFGPLQEAHYQYVLSPQAEFMGLYADDAETLTAWTVVPLILIGWVAAGLRRSKRNKKIRNQYFDAVNSSFLQ